MATTAFFRRADAMTKLMGETARAILEAVERHRAQLLVVGLLAHDQLGEVVTKVDSPPGYGFIKIEAGGLHPAAILRSGATVHGAWRLPPAGVLRLHGILLDHFILEELSYTWKGRERTWKVFPLIEAHRVVYEFLA